MISMDTFEPEGQHLNHPRTFKNMRVNLFQTKLFLWWFSTINFHSEIFHLAIYASSLKCTIQKLFKFMIPHKNWPKTKNFYFAHIWDVVQGVVMSKSTKKVKVVENSIFNIPSDCNLHQVHSSLITWKKFFRSFQLLLWGQRFGMNMLILCFPDAQIAQTVFHLENVDMQTNVRY